MIRLFLVLAFASFNAQAAAILWPGGGGVPSESKSRFNYDRTQEAKEVSDFWSTHKMAVGMATAGTYGLIGGVIAVHFHPQWSVDVGFGGGSHFQSFGFRVKKLLLLSSPLNPYFAVGFHRWERTTTRPFNADNVSPSYIGRNFLSDEDRRTNNIDEKLVHGTLGIQYVFTEGSMAGYGIFLEALLLMSVEDFQTAPTASMGFNYYF